uniref:Peptidase A1 domain-containing protein n=1 Tax=Oryza punctata TaxID=4537 RepID=A0A0E0JLR1_ORYPU
MTPSTCWMPFEKCSYNQTYEDGSTCAGCLQQRRHWVGHGREPGDEVLLRHAGTAYTVLPHHLFARLSDAVEERIEGGATIILSEEDLYIEVPEKVYCLAFKGNNSGDVIIGSKFLMSLQIVVDLQNSTMGFRDRRGCL